MPTTLGLDRRRLRRRSRRAHGALRAQGRRSATASGAARCSRRSTGAAKPRRSARVGDLVAPRTDPYLRPAGGQGDAGRDRAGRVSPIAASRSRASRSRCRKAPGGRASRSPAASAICSRSDDEPDIWRDASRRALFRTPSAPNMSTRRAASIAPRPSIDGRLDGCLFVGPADGAPHWDALKALFERRSSTTRSAARFCPARPPTASPMPARSSAPASASASTRSARRSRRATARQRRGDRQGAARRHQLRLLPAGTEEAFVAQDRSAKNRHDRLRDRLSRSRRAWSALARLPVFFALEGKRAVRRRRQRRRGLEGGAAVRRRRAGRCLCGGRLATRCSTLAGDAAARRRSSCIAARGTTPIFAGAAIAIGASRTTTMPRRFAGAARAAGVPVNVIDKPAFCDFAFGAIVNRSPLVIGISTDGAAPVFGAGDPRQARSDDPARLRALGRGRAALARRACKASGLSFAGRRRFWQLFTAHAVRDPDHEPDAVRFRPRCSLRRRAEGERVGARLGDAGRRRARRSGTADAARRARAAIGRRHPVRRSGVAARCSTSRAARRRRCWSARPAMARPASRATSTR